MRYYEVPVISGTTEEQIEQIKQYLYRQRDDLNYNLENTTPEKFWQKTADALSTASGSSAEAKSEEELRRDEYNSLRALVLKSATAVIKVEDSFSHTLQGAYLAESNFGSFMEQGFVNIKGSPYTIAQLYRYQSTILDGVNEYKTNLEGYIETGVLDRDTSSPVFGMDIGYNRNTFTFNDKEYTNAEPSKIRITPKKISFMEGKNEVAYIEKKAVYFPIAHITGGSLDINKNFTVDSFGNMKAKNADIEGIIKAKTGYIGGFEITSSSLSSNEFWPCSIASTFVPSDDKNNEYAIFLRGNYGVGGTEYGALSVENNLIGIKKRAKGASSWSNDISPYTFRVSVKGNVLANLLETTGNITSAGNVKGKNLISDGYINGLYLKANATRIAMGVTEDGATYSGKVEVVTSGEILLGKYASKASNIYLLASGTVRIGQHSTQSMTSSASNYPSTNIVQIEASSSIRIGSSQSPSTTESADGRTKEIVVKGRNVYVGSDEDPCYGVYIIGTYGVRIGQYNDTLKSQYINIRGTTITLTGATINLNATTVKVNGKTIS